jgi:hypothetical protein
MHRLPSPASAASPLCRGRTPATALSGVWLAAPLALSAAGCLITSTPDFPAPTHTRPFLLADTADPPPDHVVILQGKTPMPMQFKVDVVSQDNPAGTGSFENVFAFLYIDYGVIPPGSDLPYFDAIQSDNSLDSASLDTKSPRQLTVTWRPTPPDAVSAGCHTATLVASHHFDPAGSHCWSCDDDFTSITWQVLQCDGSPSDCDTLPLPGDVDGGVCPTAMGQPGTRQTCHDFHVLQQMQGKPSTCPEDLDGGAP